MEQIKIIRHVPKQLEHGLKDELVPLPSCCVHTKSSATSKTGRVVRRFSSQGGCLWYSCSWLRWNSLILLLFLTTIPLCPVNMVSCCLGCSQMLGKKWQPHTKLGDQWTNWILHYGRFHMHHFLVFAGFFHMFLVQVWVLWFWNNGEATRYILKTQLKAKTWII